MLYSSNYRRIELFLTIKAINMTHKEIPDHWEKEMIAWRDGLIWGIVIGVLMTTLFFLVVNL